MMDVWSIQPRDTVLFRDARPFGAGDSARTMPMPWPSTLAGFVRSTLGTNAQGEFEWTVDHARSIAICGPWIVELDADDQIVEHYFPRPADVVLFSDPARPGVLTRRRLAPRARRPGEMSDLEGSLDLVEFVDAPDQNPGKPTRGPAFWSWTSYSEWLASGQGVDEVSAADLGVDELPTETRTHVSIDPESRTALDGALFQTTMMRPIIRDTSGKFRRFGFGVALSDDVDTARLTTGASTMGGERRIVTSHRAGAVSPSCPPVSSDAELLCVVLLTPGIFDGGAIPQFDDARVVAASVGRYQPISGWDLAVGGPKATRRMAPAGSVYWVKVDSDPVAWAKAHHFTSICDEEQDRRDGFGLVTVGPARRIP